MRTRKWTLIIATICLAFILVSAITVGTTYARYVRQASNGEQNAQIAKFGVTMNWTGDLFSTEYEKNDVSYTLGDNTVVMAGGSGNGVAPGTEGSAKLTIGGTTTETAVRVTFSPAAVLTNWELKDGTAYEPIVYSITRLVEGTTNYCTGFDANDKLTWSTTETYLSETELVALSNKTVFDYAPGATISDEIDFAWKWAFEGAALTADTYYVCNTAMEGYEVGDVIGNITYTALEGAGQANFAVTTDADVLDTYLGTEGTATIALTFSATISQID